jgi:hypothetical protein
LVAHPGPASSRALNLNRAADTAATDAPAVYRDHDWRFSTLRALIRRTIMVRLPPLPPSAESDPTKPQLTCNRRKIPWRLSAPQKLRHRRRLRRVDNIVTVLSTALARQANTTTASAAGTSSPTLQGRMPSQHSLSTTIPALPNARLADIPAAPHTIKLLERWKASMPREEEMLPKDKYTVFDKKERNYRKGVHKLPKWTRAGPGQRVNPPGF